MMLRRRKLLASVTPRFTERGGRDLKPHGVRLRFLKATEQTLRKRERQSPHPLPQSLLAAMGSPGGVWHHLPDDSEGEDEAVSPSEELETVLDACSQRRNIVGFWLLGLCNNFAYVVMLSAAHDVLRHQKVPASNETEPTPPSIPPESTANTSRYDCNTISTGAVLLADILPTLLIKFSAPFCIHLFPYGAVVSAWSSGTGGAGLIGALSYLGLTEAGLSPQHTLLIMTIVPVIMQASYSFVLSPPPQAPRCSWGVQPQTSLHASSSTQQPLLGVKSALQHKAQNPQLSLQEKGHIVKGLLKYLIPLAIVYFAEYFINQGLFELLYFHKAPFSHPQQYRWYQMLYQAGVFISRSSASCVRIRHIWLLAVLQCLNMVFLLVAVALMFIPSIYLVFALVLYEGLLGGAGYVNTFHCVSEESKPEHREFAMGVACTADTLGISLSGAIAIPVHKYFCHLH
ncbi:battenin isoform X2 [Rhineura floridana]|uniref:battenin isoform X2 n=1 Tax=Rhineura floridana TaxID=261503 RepID=UPI002AC840A0|nr:battenin isoform X2 [Rhineura floridana]